MTTPDTPRVIGLDLSITAAGIARANGTTTTIRPRSGGDARLVEIRDAVYAAAGGCPPGVRGVHWWVDLAVIEDLPTHAKSAGVTGMVHGVVRALLVERRIPYALVSPATLKAFATGKGNGDKTAMAMAAFKRAHREFPGDTGGNECDAWWLRMAGLQHLGVPEVDLPAAQVARLDKVTWPDLAQEVA